ncbi:MAG: DUF2306 domain-containing protein [Bacteroidota bacterium]
MKALRSLPFLSLLPWGLFAISVYLMVFITWQYVPIDFGAAFLRLKPEEIALPYYQWAFFGHVYTSIFVLLLGGLQLAKVIRIKWPGVHRSAGKAYVLLILGIAAPTGLIMGWHANGGPWSQLSFCLQAIIWFWYTLRAWTLASRADWPGHRAFMLRSFALTFSAVTLRTWKLGIVLIFAPPPMDTYRIVAWLGWVGNLVFVEWWIWRGRNKQAAQVSCLP